MASFLRVRLSVPAQPRLPSPPKRPTFPLAWGTPPGRVGFLRQREMRRLAPEIHPPLRTGTCFHFTHLQGPTLVQTACQLQFLKGEIIVKNSLIYHRTTITYKKLVLFHNLLRHVPIPYSAGTVIHQFFLYDEMLPF